MSLRLIGRQAAAFAGRNLKTFAAAAAAGLVAFGVADRAAAATAFTGQFGAGNTWNVYELINTRFTWEEAWRFAPTRPGPTGGSVVGHLVTLTDVAENNFVHMQGGGGNLWIGLTDRVGVGSATESFNEFDPRNGGWAWVNGEPYTFADPDNPGILGYWGNLEPNDAGRPTSGEDATHIRGDGRWNDHQSGFSLDEPVANVDNKAEGQQAFRFVIEWDTMLASQPTGFPMTRPDPPQPPVDRVFPTPLAPLPGPNGTASAWGTRDVLGLGASLDTRDAVTKVLSGGGTFVNGTLARIDIIDPQTNAGTVGSVNGPTVPFVSDTAADDNNFQTVVKGTIQVPAGQGGDYTFNVRSDDGFALRVLSQASSGPLVQHPFTSARTGRVDPDGTLVFLAPTGDSNTQGVINLAPGTYDVEYLMFENGGGAFGEVSTAKGNFVSGVGVGTPRWILLGDGTVLPQEGPFPQAARLTGNAAVKNFNYDPMSNPTPASISDVIANFRTNPTTIDGTVDEVVLKGNGPICCGRPGAGLPADQQNLFPNGGADHFSTQVTGQFQILDTDGASGETLTFGLFADDNAALHIIGQNFINSAGGVNVGVFNPEGGADQWLVADFRTGNTNAFGLITLAEGNYNFESFQVEEGGDAGLEVWVAAGDRLATGLGSGAFLPLSTATLPPGFLGANQGLGLVAGPGRGPDATSLPGDFNSDGKVDAADYVVWRKNDGTQANYNLWRTNFGRTSGSGSALAAVPEPASALLTMVALLGAAFLRRRS